MLSRVADALYWMGRYAERSEHAARVLGVAQTMQLDLAQVQGRATETWWASTAEGLAMPPLALENLVFDPDEPSSVMASLSRARENARQVRDIISADMWEHVNSAHWALLEAAQSENRYTDLAHTLSAVIAASFAFTGVTDGTMSRGEGWLFTKLGQFVERADKLTRLIRVHSRSLLAGASDPSVGDDNFTWLSLLRSAAALQAYRKLHPAKVDPKRVLEFVLLNREFPHTVQYSLSAVADFAQRVSAQTGERGRAVERAFGKIASQLAYVEVDDVLDRGLEKFLGELLADLSQAGLTLQRTYFLH